MDLFEVTNTVNRAGSAFGFCSAAVTGMAIYYKDGRSLHTLKQRSVWLPWSASAATMILASAVTGGVVNEIAGTFTGTGNLSGAQVGSLGIGQEGTGAVPITATEMLSYSGSWLALTAVTGLGLFIWYAKGWQERVLALSGALTGATWGIASSVGGWTSKVSIPLVSWLGDTVIG